MKIIAIHRAGGQGERDGIQAQVSFDDRLDTVPSEFRDDVMDDDAATLAQALRESLPQGTLQRLTFELLRQLARDFCSSNIHPDDVERSLLSMLGRKEAT